MLKKDKYKKNYWHRRLFINQVQSVEKPYFTKTNILTASSFHDFYIKVFLF